MQTQSPYDPSNPCPATNAEQLPSTPLNSFQKLKNILHATRSKKIKEALQQKQAVLQDETINKKETLQLTVDDPNVDHSRSRDKRSTTKQKKTKKQSKRCKLNMDQVADSVTKISQVENISTLVDVADKATPSVDNPTQADVSQLLAADSGGIVVTEDVSGLMGNTQQNQCGQIIQDNIFEQAVVIKQPVVAITTFQKPLQSVVELNLSLHRQPVYEGWEDINPQGEKDKPITYDNRLLQSKKCHEENEEEQKYKLIHNYLNTESGLIDRFERKNFFPVDEKDWCYKSKMCYEFLKGRCKKSTHECTYAHGYQDLKHDRRSKFLCRNYTRGYCKKTQEECKFYHERPREREHSPLSQISSSSDAQRKRQRRLDTAISKKQEVKVEKRGAFKQWRRQQRTQQVRAERKQETRDTRLQERKNVRWCSEQKKIQQAQRTQENQNDKKNNEINDLPKPENYDLNEKTYLPLGTGYLPENQLHHTKNPNIAEQMRNIPPLTLPMGYGFSSFTAPIYFPTFYPIPFPFLSYPHTNINTPYNKQQKVQPNPPIANLPSAHNQIPPAHFAMPNYVPFFSQCYPPALNQFYPYYSHTYCNSHAQHNISNQTLDQSNSDNEQPVSISGDQRRQKQRYSRERKRTSSKQKSKDRKEKKHRR